MTGPIHPHRWHPSGDAIPRECGIYILHGIGEHGGRYHRLATMLTELGYEVASHDHPGHGKSAGKRGVIDHDDALVDAAIAQFRQFEQETGSIPILFGHSLGGLVATSMVLDRQLAVSGLILSAPAYAPIISTINKIKLKALKIVAPRFTQQLRYNAHLLTHDKEEQELGRNDPLNHRYKSAGLVDWIIRTGERVVGIAHSLRSPTLILIAGSDAVIDATQIQHFADDAGTENLTVHHYENYFHEILNETPERREKVMADIERWLIDLSV